MTSVSDPLGGLIQAYIFCAVPQEALKDLGWGFTYPWLNQLAQEKQYQLTLGVCALLLPPTFGTHYKGEISVQIKQFANSILGLPLESYHLTAKLE